MTKKWIRRLLAAVLLAIVALLGATRYYGLVVQNADGRVLGYSVATREWLLMEYPGYPAAVDGPYVYAQGPERWQLRLRPGSDGVIAVERNRLLEDEVEVVTDQARPVRFTVPLRSGHPRQPTTFAPPPRLLVSSDYEGEFEAFTAVMQGNGVIGADLHWSYGDGHLVLVGDMVDRGENVVPLLWLLYRLDAEAREAGGALHYVLGNHEQKLLTGRAGDAHPKYLATMRLSGQDQRQLWDENTELGRWLRSKPVLVRIGDLIFAHGGVSPEVLALAPTLGEIDAMAARHFAVPPHEVDDARARAILWDRNGLLWYRGLARDGDSPKATPAHLRQALQHFGASGLAIGHTLAEHVGQDYDGALLRIDVLQAEGVNEAVLVEDGRLFRVDAAGRRSALQAAVNLD